MDRLAENLPMRAGYFELVLRQLGTTAQTAAALLDGTGVSAELLAKPDAEITLGQGLSLLRNVNRTFPAGWSLDVGRSFQPSTHGPMGVAAISAPTLGAALDVIARYCHLRHPSHRGIVRRHHDELRVEISRCLFLYEEERLPLIETFLLAFQGLVEGVLGRTMIGGRFEIAEHAPSYAERYSGYFHAEVQFDAPVTALVVPFSLGQTRSPFADGEMYEAAMRRLEALSLRFDRVDYTAAHLEHLIAVSGDSGLTLAEAAQRFRISPRTLARRLQGAGTNYRMLRDAHLRRRAEELLRDGALSVAELANRLGYEDEANFNRACRRWFGSSPGKIRREA